MQIVIDSTNKVVRLANVECRVWDGRTSDGMKVTVFVHRVAVRADEDQSEFLRELQERREPEAVVPLRYLL